MTEEAKRKKRDEKKSRLRKLFWESNFPLMMMKFFDLESDKLYDEKIEVLSALKEGKKVSEIPNFYDILELYPRDEVVKIKNSDGEEVTLVKKVYWD